MKSKKVLALLMASTMTMSMAACGTSNPAGTVATDTADADDAGDAAEEAAQEAAEEPEEAAETTEEAAADEAESSEDAGDAADASGDLEADLTDIIPKETVTLDVYDQLANYSGEQTGWFGKIMLDKFNVKLNIIPENDGVYDTRMESGNLGDLVIWGQDGDDYQQAVDKGMLFDWEEDDLLTEYGPYIKDNMQAALEKNKGISSDGKLYGFGFDVTRSAEDPGSFMYTWDLRYDLYEEIGSPELTDFDSVVDCLAKMKEVCPTDDNGNPTYGVSLFNDWDGDMVMFVKSTATAYYGYDEFGLGLYDPGTQTFHPVLEENGPYLTALKFYNKLYQMGLLDPDSQTQGFNGMQEDYQNGTAFLNVFNFMGSALYNTPDHLESGKAMFPVKPSKATPIRYGLNVYGGNRIWSIGANTEYPELCMAIINWLSTPEGRMISEYGPKDVCWYYDENGKTCFTDIGLACKTDISTEMGNGYDGTYDDGSFKMNNSTWSLDAPNPDSNGETFNYRNWESFSTEAGSEIEQKWRDFAGADTPDEYLDKYDYVLSPGTMYTGGVHSDELQVVWDQVSTCVKDNTWKAIYASSDEEFDSIVADMIQQAEEYGYAECVEFQENEAKLRAAAEDAAMAE
ncbi:ABC transporter substrate-binding protein [Butyrivibrio sp. WCD3002]|uniref:ABC transporter substrate-binding protein n=1 Tax=Butyrivibrio sp. WCD3002 TaxID=1280676 RepID=UPI00041EE71F|nr:extracellular solute-binding protein [Butyrivibrio sp. WCD3002]